MMAEVIKVNDSEKRGEKKKTSQLNPGEPFWLENWLPGRLEEQNPEKITRDMRKAEGQRRRPTGVHQDWARAWAQPRRL